jgi:hypothetical protein
MGTVHAEVLFVAGYSLFLLAVAGGVDRLARHTHQRTDRYRTAGFTYLGAVDAWLCPEGEHLRRAETDLSRRVIRYRARAHVCNECPAREGCTDSTQGREIARPMDAWPQSEAGRFHRGICLALLFLAGVAVAVELGRHHDPGELIILGGLLAGIMAILIRATTAFRATPANFAG